MQLAGHGHVGAMCHMAVMYLTQGAPYRGDPCTAGTALAYPYLGANIETWNVTSYNL